MAFQIARPPAMPDLAIVTPERHEDRRGWFAEVFKASAFQRAGIASVFVQDNDVYNRKRHVLRGLHFQKPPRAQGKLVACLTGSIFDVAVDVRRGSPTFGTWYGTELSQTNGSMLWVPEGFAHGYCTLSRRSRVSYKVTREYSPGDELTIRWDDPDIGIRWPTKRPVVSERDSTAPALQQIDTPFRWREGL